MIRSYRDKRAREFAEGGRVKAFESYACRAEMKLDQLDAATSLTDLMLPGNHLEALKGNRKGQYSIRINDQWRTVSSGQRVQMAHLISRSSTTTDS